LHAPPAAQEPGDLVVVPLHRILHRPITSAKRLRAQIPNILWFFRHETTISSVPPSGKSPQTESIKKTDRARDRWLMNFAHGKMRVGVGTDRA
jgi:hypothetical protein